MKRKDVRSADKETGYVDNATVCNAEKIFFFPREEYDI